MVERIVQETGNSRWINIPDVICEIMSIRKGMRLDIRYDNINQIITISKRNGASESLEPEAAQIRESVSSEVFASG